MQPAVVRPVTGNLHFGDAEKALCDGNVKPDHRGNRPGDKDNLSEIEPKGPPDGGFFLSYSQREQPAHNQQGDERMDLRQPQAQENPVACFQGCPANLSKGGGTEENHDEIAPEQDSGAECGPVRPQNQAIGGKPAGEGSIDRVVSDINAGELRYQGRSGRL